MKKIIHLSDLHVGHEDCDEKFRAIIDNITFLKQPAENYIVVITGDIVDNANKKEYIDEAPHFLRIDDFEDSAVKIKIVGVTKPQMQWSVTGELRKRLKEAFDEELIELPFPQQVVHFANTPEQKFTNAPEKK